MPRLTSTARRARSFVYGVTLLGVFAVAACGEGRTPPESGASAARAANLRVVTFRSRNIYCHGCVATISARLRAMGVTNISADVPQKTMSGTYDPARLTPEAIRAAVESLGYPVEDLATRPAAAAGRR